MDLKARNNMTDEKKFARVEWAAEDVQDLKPEWSLSQCEAWLEANAKYIQEFLVQRGFEAIESLLPAKEIRND